MKKFLKKTIYNLYDTDFWSDPWRVEYIDLETDEVILAGDPYEDRTDYQIEGFKKALIYLGIAFVETKEKTNEEDWR